MKLKKEFCGKSRDSLMKRTRSLRFASSISVIPLPMRKWKLSPTQISFLNRANNNKQDTLYNGSFHEAIGPILVLAQCFGVMPVQGVREKFASNVTFNWKSFRVFFALFITWSMFGETLSTIYWTFSQRVEFGKLIQLVFYLTNCLSFICFYFLAKKWPALILMWQNVEKNLPQLDTQFDKVQLAKKIRTIAIVILSLSLSKKKLYKEAFKI